MSSLAGDLFTQLPTSLAAVVLGQWVDTVAVCRLDSAYCNHSLRPKILELFHSKELVLFDAIENGLVCSLTWAVTRMVILSSLIVTPLTNTAALTTYLDRNVRHVRSVDFSGTEQHAEVIASRCTGIEDIIFAAEDSIILLELKKILIGNPNLTTLKLKNCPPACAELFSCIRLPKLVTLSVSEADDAVLVAAVGMTENLTRLELCGEPIMRENAVIVAAIVKNCPKLRSLGLKGIGLMNGDLAELARGCPCIINLSLGNTMSLTDEGILGLVQRLKLRALHLNTSVLTDLALQHLGEYGADTLEVVNLTGFMLAPAVEEFKEKCHRLRSFHWPNEVFHPEALFALEQATILTILLNVVDQALVVLAQYTKVQILDLTRIVGDCSNLSQSAVTAFIQACPALHTIVVSKADKALMVDKVKGVARVRVTTDTSLLTFAVLTMPV